MGMYVYLSSVGSYAEGPEDIAAQGGARGGRVRLAGISCDVSI